MKPRQGHMQEKPVEKLRHRQLHQLLGRTPFLIEILMVAVTEGHAGFVGRHQPDGS
jgi:hypothetical protein